MTKRNDKIFLNSIFIFVLPLVVCLIAPSSLFAIELGSFGTTYSIIEPDALTEIEKRAGEVDWGSIFNKEHVEKTVKSYRPSDLQKLPRAVETNTFTVNMAYTLDMDIPDGKGGILYPRGYSFNPLNHVFLPTILIVLNGNDAEQVTWFKSSDFAKDTKVTLLLTEGPYYELTEQMDRPVFFADQKLIKRLKLKAVPSIVMQKKTLMEVQEIAVR